MKGICCAAQAAGDLGKPLVVTIHRKDGTTREACGVCEVVPSCRNPQKLVFAWRFLKGLACGLAGATHCTPTAQGRAQYENERTAAAARGQTPLIDVTGIPTYTLPHMPTVPYLLPPS